MSGLLRLRKGRAVCFFVAALGTRSCFAVPLQALIPPECLEGHGFAVGDAVTVEGLGSGRSALNGGRGVISAGPDRKGRFKVMTKAGSMLTLSPTQLKRPIVPQDFGVGTEDTQTRKSAEDATTLKFVPVAGEVLPDFAAKEAQQERSGRKHKPQSHDEFTAQPREAPMLPGFPYSAFGR